MNNLIGFINPQYMSLTPKKMKKTYSFRGSIIQLEILQSLKTNN